MEFAHPHPSAVLPLRPSFGRVHVPLRRPSAQSVSLGKGQRSLAFLTAVWLVLQMFDVLFTVNGSYELALTVCVVWIALPLFFAAPASFLRTGLLALIAGNRRSSLLLSAFVVASFTSAVISQDALRASGYLLATIVTLVLEFELCAYLDRYFNLALRWYSILGTLAYLPFYLRGAVAGANWGRLSVSAADHPNHFGLVCFSILGAVFAWRSWSVRLVVSGLMIAMITAAESRASLVSAIVTMTVFIALELKNRKAVLTAIVAGGIMCSAVLLSLDQLTSAVSSALNLQDQYRGIDSGLSGRVDLWRAGIDIFLEHPLLGIGFRLQNEALPIKFQAAGAVHNGFLGVLVEVGLLGGIPLFWFMAIGIQKLWRDSNRAYPGSQLGLSFVLGYLAMTLVDPYLLNLANPASVIAWCFLISGGVQAYRKAEPASRGRRQRIRSPGLRLDPGIGLCS